MAAIAAGYGLYLVAGLPARAEVRTLAKRNPGRTALMRQREAEAKAAGRRPRFDQSWVPIARISRDLIHAVITSEDQKFFGHEGVDWEAIQASLEKDLEKRRFAVGGSTISQQLVNNLFLSRERNVFRKFHEALLAVMLELRYSKEEILEFYLNHLGGNLLIFIDSHCWFLYNALTLQPYIHASVERFCPLTLLDRRCSRSNFKYASCCSRNQMSV